MRAIVILLTLTFCFNFSAQATSNQSKILAKRIFFQLKVNKSRIMHSLNERGEAATYDPCHGKSIRWFFDHNPGLSEQDIFKAVGQNHYVVHMMGTNNAILVYLEDNDLGFIDWDKTFCVTAG